MPTEPELQDLQLLARRATRCQEGDKLYILLEDLKLPEGCTPNQCDALLCLNGRDGYPTRLFFSARINSKNALNWNSLNVAILQRPWNAFSWNYVPSGRPIDVLAQHLRAFQ